MLRTQLLKNGSPNIIIAAEKCVENLGNPLERFKKVQKWSICLTNAATEPSASGGDSPNEGRKNGQLCPNKPLSAASEQSGSERRGQAGARAMTHRRRVRGSTSAGVAAPGKGAAAPWGGVEPGFSGVGWGGARALGSCGPHGQYMIELSLWMRKQH